MLYKHLGLVGLGWSGLMLLWDVEGYGELRFTCRAGPGFHVARHGGRHLHFGLYRTSKKGGSFVEKKE